jgi:hypothetical protein
MKHTFGMFINFKIILSLLIIIYFSSVQKKNINKGFSYLSKKISSHRWKGIFEILEEGGFQKQMIPEMVKNGTSVLR